MYDDSQNWPATPYCRGYTLKNTPGNRRQKPMTGWKPWYCHLKQYHACYYWLYEKGTTRAMVGLQGLHLSDVFRHSNISSSVGLKSFCPWCFKPRGNTEMVATHLTEVHYSLAFTCDLCTLFASMSTKSILDHCPGCKTKWTKECAEHEGHKKEIVTQEKVQGMRTGKNILLARLGNTKESWGAKWCPTLSFQFHWWT